MKREVITLDRIEFLSKELGLQRQFIDALPVSVWCKDKEGRILYINKKAASTLGKPIEEIEGNNAIDLGLDIPGFRQDELEVIQTGKPRIGLVSNLDQIGKIRRVDIFPFINTANQVGGVFIMEVEEEKLSHKENDLSGHFQELVNNSPDPIITIDKNLNIVYTNHIVDKVFKYTKDQLIGSSLEIFVPERFKKTHTLYIKRLCEDAKNNKEKNKVFTFPMKKANSTEITIEASISPVSLKGVDYYSFVLRDISGREKSEEQLKEINNEFQTLTYKSSHILKGPISTILGLINLARTEISEHAAMTFFNLIEKSTKLLDSTLGELLNIADIKQSPLLIEEMDFSILINKCTDHLRGLPNFEEITFRTQVMGETKFYGDPKISFYIVKNLIENAFKFRKRFHDAFIEVKVNVYKNRAEIEVSDNGVGIPEKLKWRIFEMFYRANDDSTGKGLGLYIVKSAVKKLNGKISVESKESAGSTFKVTLPNF